ncbi:phospholipase D-like domain-containing protein [Halobacillus sp. BBL2006]|uniref:phospholipase D-like domain-containing protein n=1 Tax=Halobacillus sp. BBL2006 TaxID=1543706 RepID=UPI00068E9D20|nr:phospholipase D-like domain-containing protein [Halobacillus sp. BBL2006]
MDIVLTVGGSILIGSLIGYKFGAGEKPETYSIQYFLSKKSSPQKEIIETIQNAEQTIDVAIFLFTNKNIVAELCQAAKRGVKVRVFTDRKQLETSQVQYDHMKEMAQYGIAIRTNTHDGTMHIKMLIADQKKALVGSYNFTYNAEKKNDEILVTITNEKQAVKLTNIFHDLWADGINFQYPQDGKNAS